MVRRKQMKIAAREQSYRFSVGVLTIIALASLAGCSNDSAVSHPDIRLLPDIAANGSGEPHLATTISGDVVMSWLEPDEDGVALRWSRLDGERWAPATTVATGDDWFVNWADFPSVVPISGDLWAAHWLVKSSDSTFAYDVAVSTSNDAGVTWNQPITPHEDGTLTEHGFVSLFPWQGSVGALWLDGRNMESSGDGHGHGGMTLRSAVVRDGDVPTHKTVVDELVCDCCQTDVAIGSSGPVAVYRNRTDEEIRDIYVARLENGLWEQGAPIADDGWKIAGCPVNGPAIDARGDVVAAAWFTAANGDSRIRYALSDDSGATFGEVIDVATDRPIGRVDIVLLKDGSALVSWLRGATGTAGEIRTRHVDVDGQLGADIVVAQTAAGRMSGFPQMVLRGDDIVLAWTDVLDDSTIVRTAIARVKGLIGD